MPANLRSHPGSIHLASWPTPILSTKCSDNKRVQESSTGVGVPVHPPGSGRVVARAARSKWLGTARHHTQERLQRLPRPAIPGSMTGRPHAPRASVGYISRNYQDLRKRQPFPRFAFLFPASDPGRREVGCQYRDVRDPCVGPSTNQRFHGATAFAPGFNRVPTGRRSEVRSNSARVGVFALSEEVGVGSDVIAPPAELISCNNA